MDIRPCRITGLTSDKGSKLNGSAARAPFDACADPNVRVPVMIDGVPGPLSLKRANLEFLPSGIFDGGVGVGRGTLRDDTFAATAVDNERGQKVGQTVITGGCARSRGNLIAAKAHLEFYHRRAEGGIVIMCTDLNVARAINNVASGGDAELAGSARALFRSLKELIRKETKRGAFVFANYRPHRIQPDAFDKAGRWGLARSDAVLSGAAKVYPCLYDDYRDSMEVRFVDAQASQDEVIVRHEFYLDYDSEEAEVYVKNAAALGETDRLRPSVLAQVDPQAFWSGVLHVGTFMNAITALGDADLTNEWKEVAKGVQRSNDLWRKEANASRIKLPPSVIDCDNTNWCLTSDREHEKIASGCATVALLMTVRIASKRLRGDDNPQQGPKYTKIDMLDFYRGTELSKLISALSTASRNEREHVATGNVLHEKDRDRFLKNALEQVRFGNEEEMAADPLAQCLHCGYAPSSQTELALCSRCNGAAFCNRDCQVAAWKRHKKECNPLVAHIRRAIYTLATERGVVLEVANFSGGKLPTQPCVLSETSGAGAVGIVWNPGKTSFVNFTDTNAFVSGGATQPPVDLSDMIKFNNLLELTPPVRFLLTCGPLPDINVARDCVDEVIEMTGGKIEKLRMKIALFNPLEWAAKKGNTEIVEWLCTDERTKCLVNEGCPVGWACYTGQVDIARRLVQFGADASKTDDVLFYSAPPLLVAAENGQLEAMKFLVDELGQDIQMVGPSGRNVLQSIMVPPNWKEIEGHRKAYKWAKKKMG